jgi:hypothetical protein
MATSNKAVRRTVTLPAETLRGVRGLAKKRRLSENRVIVELVEEGMRAQKRKRQRFLALASRLRAATDPKEVARLGDDLGRMIFGE